jgi:hypothetical protein
LEKRRVFAENNKMTRNIVARKHEILGTVIKVNGRTVGQVIDGVFVKDVSSSKHFLHTPEAIAYTIDTLHAAARAGAEYCDVLDTDTGTHYRASIAMIWDKGKPFNYGWGEQIMLTLPYWQASADPNNTSQSDAQDYTGETGTHSEDEPEDPKPLLYKSHATQGAVWNKKGVKTMKQIRMFGGG